jgi:hypothetical protein
MNTVNNVNVVDGTGYLVDIPTSIWQPDSITFDEVYKQVTVSSGDEDLDEIFAQAAEEYGVDVNLLKAVAQAESDFDTNAVSSCGAMGIMQLMPQTAQSLEVDDPFDARQNIAGGAKMLAYLLDDYNGDVTLALAAYNAGSGAVNRYGGVPPYTETQNYIKKINSILGGVLDDDSTTIDGAEPTQLYRTSGIEVYAEGDTADETAEGAAVSSVTANDELVSVLSGISGAAAARIAAADTDSSYTELFNQYMAYFQRAMDSIDSQDYTELENLLEQLAVVAV